ncbi:MAG: cysteine--tRNA ligase [Bacteroidota bacterium]|nr:cysteine--tRNA ligase [Bacteroidota bacterium]
MPLKLYNSLTKRKETFTPITPPHVGMYVCGPTVSGESHLGHARPYITFDVVLRYLIFLGYKVRYVRNITDAGHFEEEGREAEDKISKKALLEKVEPMELVQKYTNLFHWAMKQFNTIDPNIEPTATGHIVEQINMIEKIIAEGYAYEVNGSVYFDVKKYAATHNYGELSGRIVDDLLETTRTLAGQDEKRNKADFALWKSAPPQHIMRWKSPWGEGFPGWHIECSAMSKKYLGDRFDIHGGGMDLQFPHHESEIAQSFICNHVEPAKYWMHNNMITINGKKMGKSYNNVIKLTEMFSGNHPLLTQAFSPMTIRFFILQTHYRSTLDFSSEALVAAEKGLKRLWDAYEVLKKIEAGNSDNYGDKDLDEKINKLLDGFEEFMNDDFNTAKVLANMFEIVPVINSIKDGITETRAISSSTLNRMKELFEAYLENILGLKSSSENSEAFVGVMQLLADIRKEAKSKKDFLTSDKIRRQLAGLGIEMKDEKDGSISWNVN